VSLRRLFLFIKISEECIMRPLNFILMLLALPIMVYAQTTKRQSISNQDCAAVFAHSDVGKSTRTLEGVDYCEAWNQGAAPGEEEFLGYVFRKPLPLAGQEAYLLVGVNKEGAIARVRAQNTDMIDGEFLAQFDERSLSGNWKIVRAPEDLLHVPAKIKAMRGKPELSESIVREVKAILSIAYGKLLKLDSRS
jgi:hypothetical protein